MRTGAEERHMSVGGGEHWMALEGGADGSPGAYTSRFAAIGASIPQRRLSTDELMASTRYRTDIDLEQLTGVRERRIVGAGEDSYTLALGAARDALAHADCAAADLDMLIVSSISRHVGGLRMQLEPPVNVALKAALGAERALGLDIANACAGMMTGVFILNDLIRQGRIRRGMVVSGEYISELGRNAAQEIRTVMDDQLASLTLGDAGAAAIVERAPEGAAGIEVAGFTTLSKYSRLCVAFPATIGPGSTMHTDAREMQGIAIKDLAAMLREVLDQAGLKFDEIDYFIPHQTSVRAIKKGTEVLSGVFGSAPKHVVITIDELGNTASTTHFVALSKYLKEGRFAPEDRVLLLSHASGMEVGIVIFKVDQLVGRYGHDH
ncbi:MAG TPA: 3-oxoacyl-[acyl-carrier-protein] synthase III C-terminal domain-containing protein [Mycobacterium sp.]|nr:3-oxoacyl-[acyl-carrier-protein] synthase III C-terminal domain-containing protein [Mycobacterium sp.]